MMGAAPWPTTFHPHPTRSVPARAGRDHRAEPRLFARRSRRRMTNRVVGAPLAVDERRAERRARTGASLVVGDRLAGNPMRLAATCLIRPRYRAQCSKPRLG